MEAVPLPKLIAGLRKYAFVMGLTGQGYPEALYQAADRLERGSVARKRVGVARKRGV